MNRKLIATLVSACALAAVLAGSATASAATLTLNSWAMGQPATIASFDSPQVSINGLGWFKCDEFTLGTQITQNEADPVTLQAWDGYIPLNIDDCWTNSTTDIKMTDIELTGPMTFNANGTGTLPLRLTETWYGTYPCTREGTLNLTYTPNQSEDTVGYNGTMTRTSGSCIVGPNTNWSGYFHAPTDDYDYTIEWIVTP